MSSPQQNLINQQIHSLPTSSGVYILHLNLNQQRKRQIGRLGEFSFPAGEYLYIGSALGPGGLKARLGRHLKGGERRHWHIDWLRDITTLRGCFYAATGEHHECNWSQFLIHQPGARVLVPGFGASDCSKEPIPCPAHLVWFENGLDGAWMRNNLPVNGGHRVSHKKFPFHFRPDSDDIE